MRYIEERQLLLNNRHISYEFERKNIKNINLRIRPDSSVYVSANPVISIKSVEKFMVEKTQFILHSIDAIAKMQQEYPICQLEEGNVMYLAGKPYTLHIETTHFPKAYHDADTIYIGTPSAAWEDRLKTYNKLLRQEASHLFPASVHRVYPLIKPYGVAMPKFQTRFMKSRWGSCMPFKENIHLSAYLAVMPEQVIDQVVLHELCHLIHPNHSKDFYALLTTLMPRWKEYKNSMKKYMSYCIYE